MTKYLKLIFQKPAPQQTQNYPHDSFDCSIALYLLGAGESANFANQMLADTTSSVRILCRTKMGLGYPLPVAYKTKLHDPMSLPLLRS